MSPDDFRQRLLECLGGPWPEPCPLRPTTFSVSEKEGYRIESVAYDVEPGERVVSLLLVPEGVDAHHPAPAVAVWHQHNARWDLGKSEPAGLVGDPVHQTGAALARSGYVVLCPDALGFEDRRDPCLAGGDFERFVFLRYLVRGKCLAWKNILDMRRAVDVLASRPEVRPGAIGCFGHSMGATHAWLVGPWEPRLACLVANCCLPTYAAIERHRLLHCFSNYIPGLARWGDTPDVAALIAPRPLLMHFGAEDPLSPIEEVHQGIETVRRAYQQAGAAEAFSWLVEPTGHTLSPRMWNATLAFLGRHLPV